jgi:hypothetical protein
MGPVEVLPQPRNGNIEIEIIVFVQDAGYKMDEETVGGVLVGSELHFHSPKLYSPADVVIDRNLQTNGIPISFIEHLENHDILRTHFFKFFRDDQNISFEDVCNVKCHFLIKLYILFLGYLPNPLDILFLCPSVKVVVLLFVYRIVPKVVVGFTIP